MPIFCYIIRASAPSSPWSYFHPLDQTRITLNSTIDTWPALFSQQEGGNYWAGLAVSPFRCRILDRSPLVFGHVQTASIDNNINVDSFTDKNECCGQTENRRQTERQIEKQTNRQIDRQTNIHRYYMEVDYTRRIDSNRQDLDFTTERFFFYFFYRSFFYLKKIEYFQIFYHGLRSSRKIETFWEI